MAKLNAKQLEAARAELKSDARKRVADRGVLQFRADSQTILAVIAAAERANMPVGALLRQWVQEKLVLAVATEKAPDLVKRVDYLEQKVDDLLRRVSE